MNIPINKQQTQTAKEWGFDHLPPTQADLDKAAACTALHLAEIEAEIASQPKLKQFADGVTAEIEMAMQLCRLRKRAKKTQAQLAAALGITQGCVARIESGRPVRIDTIRRYAAACGYPGIKIRLEVPRTAQMA